MRMSKAQSLDKNSDANFCTDLKDAKSSPIKITENQREKRLYNCKVNIEE
jgi:hypothetical protein